MARILALFLGLLLAGVILLAGLWIRNRPEPTHDVELHVVDARGHPIERFGWDLCEGTPPAPLGFGVPEAVHPGGIATARVPARRLTMEIHAQGLHRTRVGPFEEEALPARLDVVLTDLGVVSGIVTVRGQPVGGSEVMLIDPWSDVAPGIPSGLFFRFEDLAATTDATGAFRIGSDYPERQYYVRASKSGYAAAVAGPVHVGDPPFEIQLSDGGSIEGKLLLPDAGNSEGAEIELYRPQPVEWDLSATDLDANGHLVVRADMGGHFRFEHVERGPWLVRLKPPERKDGGREQLPPLYLPFLVNAAEHDTVVLDMDLTQAPARLEGRMMNNGKPWRGAFVFLHVIGERALVLDKAPADMEGRWTLRARAPGRYRIVARGNHERARDPDRLTDIVELSRDVVRWQREFGPSEIVSFGDR